MKINKSLLMISLLLISLLAISAASAADDIADTSIDVASPEIDEVTVDDVQTIDEKAKNSLSDDAAAKDVSVVAKETPYNENVTIDITANKELISNESTMQLFIDGQETANITLDSEGKGSYVIPATTYEVGNYFIEAIMKNGDATLADRTSLKITKVTPVISVDDVTVKSGDYINIPFNVTDNKGNKIGGDVIVTIFWENDVISKHINLGNGTQSGFDIADIIGILGGNSTNSSNSSNGSGFDFSSLTNRTNSTNSSNGSNSSFDFSSLTNRTNSTNSSNSSFDFSSLTNRTNSTNGTNGSSFDFSSLTNRTGNSTNTSDADNATEVETSLGGDTGDKAQTADANSSGNSSGLDLGAILDMLMGGNKTVAGYAYVFEKGVYNISVEYLNNRNYNAAINDTAKLTITPMEDVLLNATVESAKNLTGNTTASILLTDGYEKPIAGGTIKVALNGEEQGSTTANEEGKATYNFEGLAKGDYNLTLSYNDTNKSFGFFVDVERINTVIEYQDMNTTSVNADVDGRIGEWFTFTLKDETGKILSDRFIQVGFNGKIYNRTTDENGSAKLQINLISAGFYTFAVCFLGDDTYNASFVVAKITVNKQDAKLTTKAATYKASAKTKNIKATFKSANGNAIEGKKITFTVNGKTYSAKTDSNGVATVNVSLSKKGTYSFTVKYAGDNAYNKISTKGKLTIK